MPLFVLKALAWLMFNAVGAAVLWSGFAFVAWEVSPGQWTDTARILAAIFFAFFEFGVTQAVVMYREPR